MSNIDKVVASEASVFLGVWEDRKDELEKYSKLQILMAEYLKASQALALLNGFKADLENFLVEAAEVERKAGRSDIPMPSGETLRISFTENATYTPIEVDEAGKRVKQSPIPEICAAFPDFNDLFKVSYGESGAKLANLLNTEESLTLMDDNKKSQVFDFLEMVKKYRKVSLSKPKIEIKT